MDHGKGVTYRLVMQDALVWRIVDDDNAGPPACCHIALKRCLHQVKVP